MSLGEELTRGLGSTALAVGIDDWTDALHLCAWAPGALSVSWCSDYTVDGSGSSWRHPENDLTALRSIATRVLIGADEVAVAHAADEIAGRALFESSDSMSVVLGALRLTNPYERDGLRSVTVCAAHRKHLTLVAAALREPFTVVKRGKWTVASMVEQAEGRQAVVGLAVAGVSRKS